MITDLTVPLRELATKIRLMIESEPMEDPEGTMERLWNFREDGGIKEQRGYTPRVSFLPGFKSYAGRIWIAGKHRTVTTAPIKSGVTLARFMDMVGLHFWKYRQRNVRPLADDDLIFSVDDAKRDWEDFPHYVALVEELEKLLQEHNALPVLRREGEKREDTRTVRHAVKQLGTEMRMNFEELNTKLDSLAKLTKELRAAQETILVAVAALPPHIHLKAPGSQHETLGTVEGRLHLERINEELAKIPCHRCGCLVDKSFSYMIVDPKDLNSSSHRYCRDCYTDLTPEHQRA
jgi:hypothetical protein